LYPVRVALLAAVYFGAAKLGLAMAFVAEQVTAVWPPTGIALAALLLFGYRAWPGIALGAFLANATTNAPPATAAGIALGNTLEALLGAWMLRRLVQFDPALGRVKDVLSLVVLAAGVSTMVSAAIGVTSLCLGGVKSWTAYPTLWGVWWLGDVMGDLVVAPLLLTWAGWQRIAWRPRRVAEAGALLLALVAVSLLVFAGPTAVFSFHPLAYTVFPFMICAALRCGQPAVTLMTFVASGVAIWGTVGGYGPFVAPTTHESLLLVQVFMGVVAVTALVLGAVTIERERAKEAARQSRDELRLTLEAARVGTWNWDQHTGKVSWSDNLEAIHGLAPGTFGGTFEAFLESVHPEDRDKVLQAIRSALEELKDYEIEYRSFCADGSLCWMGGRGRVVYDGAGRPPRMLGICSDITPRKQAEASLRQSYDLLHAVIEGTSDAVFVKDRQGRYLMINTAGARFLGRAVAEVIGKDDTELFSPETARSIMEGDRRIMATGAVQTYEDVGAAAGVTRTYLSTKGPYRDAQGNVIGVIGISRDITTRKRSERRLAAVHAVTSALARSASLEEAAAPVLQTVGKTLCCDLGVLWEVDAGPTSFAAPGCGTAPASRAPRSSGSAGRSPSPAAKACRAGLGPRGSPPGFRTRRSPAPWRPGRMSRAAPWPSPCGATRTPSAFWRSLAPTSASRTGSCSPY
jgi:PAS domain S-box-containing protein